MPISLRPNSSWENAKTRPKCKYAPVIVAAGNSDAELKEIVARRIRLCQDMALIRGDTRDTVAWFSFVRPDKFAERGFGASHVPIFVLSGGNSKRIKTEFDSARGYSLAWHPATVKGAPVYLFVHADDYEIYARTLSAELAAYRNLLLVGWNGGAMSGFGTARAAALAYADTLPYAPQRLIMMDQDVAATESTRVTSPSVTASVMETHASTGKPVVGYGVGFPTRSTPPSPTEQLKSTRVLGADNLPKVPAEEAKKKDRLGKVSAFTPTQQFVSIMAPFRRREDARGDGIYPAYMVAGGEDMLMTAQEELQTRTPSGRPTANPTVRGKKIVKLQLPGDDHDENPYWTGKRVDTLKRLYASEKDTLVEFNGKTQTIAALCDYFALKKFIKNDPTDKAGTGTLIIERIILMAQRKAESWPDGRDRNIFNRTG